jgi:O-antigen ligase
MDTVPTERIRNAVLLATTAVYAAGYATNGFVLMIAVAIREALSRTWRWIPTSLDRSLAAFILAAFLSTFSSEWPRQALTNSTLLLMTAVLSVRTVAAYVADGAAQCRRFLTVWAAGGAAAALWILAQFDPTNTRLPGTGTLGSNAAGTTLALSAVITLGLLLDRTSRRRWWLAAVLAVISMGLVATWARAAWVGAAAGMITLMALGLERRARVVSAVLLLVLVGAAAWELPRWRSLNAEIRSIVSLQANRNRIVLWKALPRMIRDRPVLGAGFGVFGLAYPRYRLPDAPDPTPSFAHNLLLNALVETGIIGFVAVVALCVSGFASSWRWMIQSPRASPERAAAVSVVAALVALFTIQTVDSTIMYVHVAFGFFALLTLGAVGERYLAGEGPARGGRHEKGAAAARRRPTIEGAYCNADQVFGRKS